MESTIEGLQINWNTDVFKRITRSLRIAGWKFKGHFVNGILCLQILLCSGLATAQVDEFAPPKKNGFFSENRYLKETIIPASLLIGSILISDSDFEKDLQKSLRDQVGNDFSTSLDDYMRDVPVLQMYIADIAGVQARNHWFDQTKNLIIASIVTELLTRQLKDITGKERPNGQDFRSWPSGHTSHAFVTATVLHEEFKETSPLLAYSGYLFAATTGYLRMANNKHYLSDVMAGAGLGILITKLVYRYEHLFSWNPFLKDKNITLLPRYTEGTIGFHFVKKF